MLLVSFSSDTRIKLTFFVKHFWGFNGQDRAARGIYPLNLTAETCYILKNTPTTVTTAVVLSHEFNGL